MKIDNGSIYQWNHEDGTTTRVGDLVFYEPTMTWLVVDEITSANEIKELDKP
jgi:hypothetical protein